MEWNVLLLQWALTLADVLNDETKRTFTQPVLQRFLERKL